MKRLLDSRFFILMFGLFHASLALADCSEIPVTYDQFVGVAQKPEVHDVVSFLKALPKNSLTNVTLVHTSESLQKVAISPLLPGVIRGSADGKLIFRYVCEKNSELSDRIEVLRFDEKEKQFKTSSLHFSGSSRPAQKTQISEDPAECIHCHEDHLKNNLAAKFLKPVWDSYPLWPGLYGSNEDQIHPSKYQRKEAKRIFPNSIKPEVEEAAFAKFAENEAQNPCYQASLPEGINNLYSDGFDVEESNAHRPNLRFSEVLGLLSAQSLTKQISKQENLKEILPELARATFGCGENKVSDPDEEYDPSGDLLAPRTGFNGRFLTALEKIGVQDAELDLSLHGMDGYDFVGGFYAGKTFHKQDVTSVSLLRSQIAELLAQQKPEFKLYYHLSRGVSEGYPETNNACIDDLGGRITASKKDRVQICKLIEQTWPMQAGKTAAFLDQPLVNRDLTPERLAELKTTPGYRTILNSCADCHATDVGIRAPQYLANVDIFLNRVAHDEAFSARIQKRIHSSTATMPPGNPLPANEVQNIVDFLNEAQR